MAHGTCVGWTGRAVNRMAISRVPTWFSPSLLAQVISCFVGKSDNFEVAREGLMTLILKLYCFFHWFSTNFIGIGSE